VLNHRLTIGAKRRLGLNRRRSTKTMKWIFAILIALTITCVASTEAEGPLLFADMPASNQQMFQALHQDLMELSRKHLLFDDFRSSYPPDCAFERPMICFEDTDIRLMLEVHSPEEAGWAGIRFGPDATGGSITTDSRFWLQFNIIAKDDALRDNITACITKAFGKPYGIPINQPAQSRDMNSRSNHLLTIGTKAPQPDP